MLKIPIKKVHPNAVIPSYAREGDACVDLIAVERDITSDLYIEYDTGLQVAIPEGYEGQIRARSSVSKKGLILCNGIGTIDSGYRGNIKLRFYINDIKFCQFYEVGEAIGQLVIKEVPKVSYVETDELDATERGEGGFGSTDK